MERQRSWNNKHNIEKKEQSWKTYTLNFQDILLNYNNQDKVVLAKRQTFKSVEPNQ